ncbi:SsgA family sporulation/cell division regulator [Streptomyces gobiensis]|uniref:SsgA family sporulation/cell division regulator n=1 Tax=Streptomyces gobiensis TaxID=2875706 RepID=UPI001E54FC8E|nr:SsgA family sporulation/cell division regulator [Streptomyces gobiensis]UGY91876.1 SsgA family sporulation/cell division regulator [Streptomyces gobiensis]
MPAAITHTVQARIIVAPPASRSVTVGLRYDREDPVAVRIVFPPQAALDGEEVAWTFGRELLEVGLRAPAGEGDVHVWPCGPARTVVELRALEGVAMIQFTTTDLRQFLGRSYAVVPKGREHVSLDLDRGLAALLG